MEDQQLPIKSDNDIVMARQAVRRAAQHLGLSLVDQTKIVTASSELARNTLIYGMGGEMRIEHVIEGTRRGLKIAFIDKGPGIPNVELALTDGWTSGNGLGMGLSGARRLVHDFKIETRVGEGTTVAIVRWK
jgi:serine/threonine-protein kinase RsbT